MRRVLFVAACAVATHATASAPAFAQTAQTAPAPAPAPAPPAEATPAPAPEATVDASATVEPAAPEPAVALTTAEPAPEAEVAAEVPVSAAWYDSIGVHGFASVAYTFNANRPVGDNNQARVFDGKTDTVGLDVVELVVERPVGDPGSAGFRFDLTAGSALPELTASSGLFRDPDTGEAEDVDLQQAYVSYVAPVGAGLRLDVGKFVTHMGYELIEGYDGYNDHYSRSILFGYAIPFTHTGAKLSYPISDALSAMVMVANGWDNVQDNNSGKTLGAQVIYKTGPATLYFNGVAGPEQADENGNWRVVGDFVGTATFGAATVGVNADYGFEQDAVGGTESAAWYGAAVYGKYALSPSVDLAARAEYFDDPDAVRGIGTSVFEGTVTPSLKLGDAVVLRADFRLDVASDDIFVTDDSPMTADGDIVPDAGTQFTFALNALAHI
jgi:hypothetical protein